jgi:predicted dithiol-disulfide oxidoreductase (DUF899 family)
MKEAATPKIVSREEWEQARAELLVREKEHTCPRCSYWTLPRSAARRRGRTRP